MCRFKDTTLGIKKFDFNEKRGMMPVYMTDGREALPQSGFATMHRFRFLILFLFVLSFSIRAYSTAQQGEYIFMKGKMYTLFTCPLEFSKDLKEELDKQYPLTWESTDLWRGYIGYWSIKENSLYLDSLQCNIKDIGHKTIVSKESRIFQPYMTGKGVCARWFSGELRVIEGKLVKYVHSDFVTIFEHETFLTIEKGVIKGKRTENNSLVCANSIENIEVYNAFREAFKQEFPDYAANRIVCSVSYSAFDRNGKPTEVDVKIVKMREEVDRKEDIMNFVSKYLLEHRIIAIYNLNGKYKSERFAVVFGE